MPSFPMNIGTFHNRIKERMNSDKSAAQTIPSKRRITISEARKLQSFPENYDFSGETKFNAYKQLGNAVNVEVIYQVFKKFMDFLEEKVKEDR